MTAPREPMGWLPDPSGRFDERFRMRRGWTQRVRVGAAEAVDTDFDPDADPGTVSGSESRRDPAEDGEWRSDPTGRFDQRWWEAGRFTRRVRHDGSVATDTISPPRTRRRWRLSGPDRVDPDGPGWRPDPEGEGERYHDGHGWTATWRPGHSGSPNPPGSLGDWLPRTVARVGWTVLVVLVVVAALVGIGALVGLT